MRHFRDRTVPMLSVPMLSVPIISAFAIFSALGMGLAGRVVAQSQSQPSVVSKSAAAPVPAQAPRLVRTGQSELDLIQNLEKAGRPKEAIAEADSFLKQRPQDPAAALVAYQRAIARRGGVEKLSLTDLTFIASHYRMDTTAAQHVRYELGVAYYDYDQVRKAADEFQKLVDFNPAGQPCMYSDDLISSALQMQIDIYNRLRLTAKRDAAVSVLNARFPNSVDAKDVRFKSEQWSDNALSLRPTLGSR